jgi:dihydroorotate dehydrogenase (NAD+) catalytic subunit
VIDLAPQNPYGLSIATPLIAAAGSLGYGLEYARQLGFSARPATHGLGALITRTTSLRPRRARPLPALVETPAGLILTGSAQNPGLRPLRERFATAWASWDLPIIVSIFAEDAAETAELLAGLEELAGVRGIELPLAAHGVIDAAPARRLVAGIRMATQLPLIVKLPGEAPDLAGLAQAVVEAGADTIALIDGLPAEADPADDGQRIAGRLYGPALFPLALRAVAAVAAAAEVPIIGLGGIYHPTHVRAMLSAGASAVGLGSALLVEPWAMARIASELGAL